MAGYRAGRFIEYTRDAERMTEMNIDFMMKVLEHIKVFEDEMLNVVFLDEIEIECKKRIRVRKGAD